MKKYISRVLTSAVTMMLVAMYSTVNVKADDAVIQFTKDLAVGTTFNDELSEGNGKYNFTISRSGTLTVQMGVYEGSGYSWGYHGGATLYDSNGRKIANLGIRDSTSGTDTAVFTVDVLAGSYYIYVDRAHGKLSYYLLTSYVDSGETVVDSLTDTHNSQANPIGMSIGASYVGHIADNSTSDVYTFTSNKHQYVTLQTNNQTNGIIVKIINENNTVNREVKVSGNAESIKVFCPKGKYYVTMSKYSGSDNPHTGVYTLKATTSDIPTTKISKVSNKRGKIMAVKFGLKSTEMVDGYQIQYSTHKKFKKSKKSIYVTNSDYLKSTYTFSVKKKTYYVHIRTYVEDNRGNRYYSKWSPTKKVTIKK